MVQFYTNLTMAAVCLHITCSSMHLYQESDGNVEFFFGGGALKKGGQTLGDERSPPAPNYSYTHDTRSAPSKDLHASDRLKWCHLDVVLELLPSVKLETSSV